MPTPENYGRLFRNLAHMVALSQEQKVAGVVDSLVATALTIDPTIPATSSTVIVEAIDAYFGLKFQEKDLQSSVDRLLRVGRLQRNPAGKLVPSAQTRAEIDSRVQDAHELEKTVRKEWLDAFWKDRSGRNAESDEELWNCLRAYMARAFERHGAETTLLLDPTAKLPSEIDESLASYLKHAIETNCRHVDPKTVKAAVREFFVHSTPARSRYIAQLLDGTFSFFAICVDEPTSVYLKRAIQPVSIFLDTNFVFGLLKLHDNPMNEVSEELVQAIKSQNFPFKLFYHERTLQEFQSAIRNIRYRMLNFRWTQDLSRAALRVRSLSIIELRYHEANAVRPVDARAFLAKYEHVEELLREKGFSVYREPQRSPAQIEELDKEQTLLIAKYNAFLVNRLGLDRAKAYRTIEHDMAVWQTVKYLRHGGSSVLDIGALFLTADRSLYAFDWQQMRPSGGTGHVILPDQLLQLLRPFLVVTEDFDKKFAATFAIPEFRTAASGYGTTASKVLAYLTTFADVTEETASRILANEVLLGRLRDVSIDAPEFKKLIDSELVRDNEQLLKENERLLAGISDAERSTAGVASELNRKATLLQQHERLLSEQKGLAEARDDALKRREQQLALEKAARGQKEEEVRNLEKKLQDSETARTAGEARLSQLARRHGKLATGLRVFLAVIVFLSATVGFIYAAMTLPWLVHHNHRIGITLCAILVFAGLCWSIGDTHTWRRRTALIALVIASIVTLIQVIDPNSREAEGEPAQFSPTPSASPRGGQ